MSVYHFQFIFLSEIFAKSIINCQSSTRTILPSNPIPLEPEAAATTAATSIIVWNAGSLILPVVIERMQ